MLPRDPVAGSFFDLSDRTKLRVTGVDRIRYVNGQITNDIRKASESTGIAACVLNAKGKLDAHVWMSLDSTAIFIDAEASLRDTLGIRLERYVFADDVQIEDLTDQFSLIHVLGARPSLPAIRLVSLNRFNIPGFDVWVNTAEHDQTIEKLGGLGRVCDADCAEVFRIEHGVPKWGYELTHDIIPVEANLEESCIDYAKGCYIGQEVISRMKMSGQRNKSLCGLIASGDTALVAGMELHPRQGETRQVGWVTSATMSDRLGKRLGLAYVKRPFNRVGIELNASTPGSPSVGVEVVGLPFTAALPVSD